MFITTNTKEISLKKNFMPPFYGYGSTALRLESHYKESLFLTTNHPGLPGIPLNDLGRMKG